MKAELQVKYLQYLNAKKPVEEGFTLIELLVVILILGVLAAIALPNFLGQSIKGRQTEAKIYINSLNKNQQSFYFERGRFATYIDELGLGRGIATITVNYTYTTTNIGGGGTSSGAWSYTMTTPTSGALKNYSGLITLKSVNLSASTIFNSVAVLCEEQTAGAISTQPIDGETCNANQNLVGK